MSIQLNPDQSQVMSGLGTATFTVATAGFYTLTCQSTIPPNSALSIAVNKNGSSQFTVNAPTPTQASISAGGRIQCAATDTLTVVLTSANAVDSVPNTVKSVINLFQGE